MIVGAEKPTSQALRTSKGKSEKLKKKIKKKVLTNNQPNAIMIIVNEREVNKMKTVIIEYAVIDPITLINKIEKAFPGAMARFTDIDEDYFELSVWGCTDLEMLEDVLAEYV